MKSGGILYYWAPSYTQKKEITNIRNKANVAFYTYKNLWLDNSESRKFRLYEALVTSVLLYNCSCWAAPKKALDSVDVLQRKNTLDGS